VLLNIKNPYYAVMCYSNSGAYNLLLKNYPNSATYLENTLNFAVKSNDVQLEAIVQLGRVLLFAQRCFFFGYFR
jgi:hypothetical protein